jgi:hypothetical protein
MCVCMCGVCNVCVCVCVCGCVGGGGGVGGGVGGGGGGGGGGWVGGWMDEWMDGKYLHQRMCDTLLKQVSFPPTGTELSSCVYFPVRLH